MASADDTAGGGANQVSGTPGRLARALEAEQRARRERWWAITALARAGVASSQEIALSVAGSGLASYEAVAAHLDALRAASEANQALAHAGTGLESDYEVRCAPQRGEPGRFAGDVLVRRREARRETSAQTVAALLQALEVAGFASTLPSGDHDALAVEIDFAGIPVADADQTARSVAARASTS